ncbi:MAG: hypothetical protein JXM70_22475 [Pirellulales bacterium]|nr:hypothetical protein [Pirellulales bacterium]
MDFQQRLAKAVERGQKKGNARAKAAAEKALNEQEMRRLHSQYRLELCEHIEECLKNLPLTFPGFEFVPIVDESGWGAAVSRDDVTFGRSGGRYNSFSRLEMVVRPMGKYHVLDLASKATIANKEIFNRNHYQRLGEADLASFTNLIDLWVLEYAEMYATKR